MKIYLILSVILSCGLTAFALYISTGEKKFFWIAPAGALAIPGIFSIRGLPLLFLTIPVFLYFYYYKRSNIPNQGIILSGLAVSFASLFDASLLVLTLLFLPGTVMRNVSTGKNRLLGAALFVGSLAAGYVLLFPISAYIAVPYKILSDIAAPEPPVPLLYAVLTALLAGLGIYARRQEDWKTVAPLLAAALTPLLMGMAGIKTPILCQIFIAIIFVIFALAKGHTYITEKINASGFGKQEHFKRILPIIIILPVISLLFFLTPNQTDFAKLFINRGADALNRIRGLIPEGGALLVTEHLPADVSQIADKYRITTFPTEEFSEKKIHALDAVLNNPFYLIPEFKGYSSDPSVLRIVQGWEQFRSRLESGFEFPGAPTLLDYYYVNPLETPGFKVGKLKKGSGDSAAPVIFNPWRRSVGKNRGLTTFSSIGEFELLAMEENKKTISARSIKPDANGWRKITLGYLLGSPKFPLAVPVGKHLFLTADIAVRNPMPLTRCELILREKDDANQWKTKTIPVHTAFRNTAAISKEISLSSRFVLAGIMFSPVSDKERLFIRGIRLVVVSN